jgi:AcrR family transcriptional regulator
VTRPTRKNALANRERILVAAEAVFGERGALGSTEDVARRANVGIATVFRHFPTKEALIEAALLRHFALLNAQAEALAAEPDAAGALRRLLATLIETGATKLTLGTLVGDPPEPVLAAAQTLRATIGVLLERAKSAGTVHPDVTVDEVYVLLRGLSQANATLPPDPATLQRAIEIVHRGLAPG